MYTKIQFGIDLKEMLKKTQNPYEIGIWAFDAYWDHIMDLEDEVREIAIALGTMELGPEFAISHNMLNKIADDLIAGKDVDLNSEKYREVDF